MLLEFERHPSQNGALSEMPSVAERDSGHVDRRRLM